jgi:nicotinamidase-related amidase
MNKQTANIDLKHTILLIMDYQTAIHNDIAPLPSYIIVRKSRVGAFSTTVLDEQLKECKINTLALSGITTSGVVPSTIRDAADRDYHIYILEDTTADPDQEVHDLLMQKEIPRHGHVISSSDLSSLVETA